ncbi:hypothetical protein KH5H1_08050 [Corallococcus caeni]|uniref:hypothetical protein n=1 Tax=Corallococcus caeni TaxID=3082388 RepID=UPI0029565A09|nr:hypothetical protein KH5H1_08050 [Corallococcus sp. KH5-1]
MDYQNFLRTILPAGEWSDINVVNGDGMMNGRNWATLATARWHRKGGVAAFIKFIHAAGPAAGRETRDITDAERLRQILMRVQRIAQSPSIPSVAVLDARMILDKGLLLAMEQVTVIQTLVDKGLATPDLAITILRDLDPDIEAGAQKWHHFDVCARNLGLTNGGKPVYLDIESIYFEDAGRIPVTLPAFKAWRLPSPLKAEVVNTNNFDGQAIHLNTDLATRKIKSEIMLVAAECCLGPIPYPIDPLDWLKSFKQNTYAIALLDAYSRLIAGQSVSLTTLASTLRSAGPIEAPFPPPLAAPVAQQTKDATAVFPRPTSPSENGDWQALHATLTEQARALRRAELNETKRTNYRTQLEDIANRFPEALPVWNELLLLAISYERDRDNALSVVNRALSFHRDNKDLQHWKQILSAWSAE